MFQFDDSVDNLYYSFNYVTVTINKIEKRCVDMSRKPSLLIGK